MHTVTPKNWSSLTRAPYYKEKFAIEFRNLIDEMIAEQGIHEKIYKLDGFTPATIYARVNQSQMYLLHHLDSDYKYAQFLENVSIKRVKNVGVILSYNRNYEPTSYAAPNPIELPLPDLIENWINNMPKKQSIKLKIDLDNEILKAFIETSENIWSNLSTNLLIMKITR